MALVGWGSYLAWCVYSTKSTAEGKHPHSAPVQSVARHPKSDQESPRPRGQPSLSTSGDFEILEKKIREMVEADPLGAADFVMPYDGPRRPEVLDCFIDAWVNKDVEACFKWANSLDNPRMTSAFLLRIVALLCEKHREAEAVDLIKRMPTGEFRDDMTHYSLVSIAKYNWRTAIELAQSLSGGGALRAAGRQLSEVALETNGPDEIAALIDELPYGALRDQFRGQFLISMFSRQPKEAFEWVQKNPAYYNSAAVYSAANTFIEKNPEEGLEFAKQIANPKTKQELSEAIGIGWGRKAPKAATKWALEEISSGNYNKNAGAIDAIIAESLQLRHDQIFAFLDQIKNDQVRTSVSLKAAAAMSKFNPSEAAKKFESLPNTDSDEQLAAAATLTRNWLNRDPMAASKWVQNLAEGKVKDFAIGEVVENIIKVDGDLEAATVWAGLIRDSKRQTTANTMIENSMIKTNNRK